MHERSKICDTLILKWGNNRKRKVKHAERSNELLLINSVSWLAEQHHTTCRGNQLPPANDPWPTISFMRVDIKQKNFQRASCWKHLILVLKLWFTCNVSLSWFFFVLWCKGILVRLWRPWQLLQNERCGSKIARVSGFQTIFSFQLERVHVRSGWVSNPWKKVQHGQHYSCACSLQVDSWPLHAVHSPNPVACWEKINTERNP